MADAHAADVLPILTYNYPWVNSVSRAPTFFDPANDASKVAGILELLSDIPNSLHPPLREDRLTFKQVIAALRQLLEDGRRGGSIYWPTVRNNNVLTALWLLLQKCPDVAVPETAAGLEFIADHRLRESILTDISTAESTLTNGEWKAATVFAAVAMEALLLVAILSVNPSADAENWRLPRLIEEARGHGKISDEAAKQARLAKDYRNLIHPGKEKREGQTFDRAAAYGAASALQFVVRDLSRP